MSDNIPFEIQTEIMKKLPVKSLLQFRSVSKPLKSVIDSSRFIADYSGPVPHLLLRYDFQYIFGKPSYESIVDDESFPNQRVYPPFPLLVKSLKDSRIIGCSHGLLCLFGYHHFEGFRFPTVVLWNVSIRKAVDVHVPDLPHVGHRVYETRLGFGVCRETCDPKIIKIKYINSRSDPESISGIPFQVEVFTLSTGAWRIPYGSNFPRKSIRFGGSKQVVVDGFLYWLVADRVTIDGGIQSYNLIVSFDITREEFREVNLPGALAHHEPYPDLSLSKQKESLVLLQRCGKVNDHVIHVWMMGDGVLKSFTKMLTISPQGARSIFVRGFRKSGEPVIDVFEYLHDPRKEYSSLVVYEPHEKQIINLGISQWLCYFSLYSYVETLLLLDQPDPTTYDDYESGEEELDL